MSPKRCLRWRGSSAAWLGVALFLGGLGPLASTAGAEEEKAFHAEVPASLMDEVAEGPNEKSAPPRMWSRHSRPEPFSLHGALVQGSIRAAEQGGTPAKSVVSLPKGGTYYLWVRYATHPARAKAFTVALQGHVIPFAYKPYGGSPDEEIGMPTSDPGLDWSDLEQWKAERQEIYGDRVPEKQMVWTRREVQLATGTCEIILSVMQRKDLERGIISHAPEVDSLLLTSDPAGHP